MNKKQKIIISVTGIFLVLLLLVGLTYAYFLTRINGNTNTKSISVSTANLALVYGDGNGIIEPEDKILPGQTIDSKTFTVKNEGNDTTDYVVVIEDVSVTDVSTGEATTFESNDFVYTLTCTSDGEACNGVNTEVTFPITGGILVGNSIEVGKTHTYSLTVTYKDTGIDQSNDMNKTLTAKVNIADPNGFNPYLGDKTTLAYNIINNAINNAEFRAAPLTIPGKVPSGVTAYTEGTLATSASTMSRISSFNTWTYGEGYTFDEKTGTYSLTGVKTGVYSSIYSSLVGKYLVSRYEFDNIIEYAPPVETNNKAQIYQVASATEDSLTYKEMSKATPITTTEAELSSTEDDYGTSYYYRGTVENNYVNFSGMCWRIVRVQGDGGIKITLADRDHECNSAEYSADNEDSAFITPTSQTFGNDIDHIVTALNAWLTGGEYTYFYLPSDSGVFLEASGTFTKKIDDSKLINTEWCNDISIASKFDIYDGDAEETYTYFYYGPQGRLENRATANPSLKCNFTGMDDSKAERVTSKIGMLTADEFAFAGGGFVEYSDNYLNDNAKTYYATLSRYGTYPVDLFIDVKNSSMGMHNLSADKSPLRPAVVLSSNVTISSGDGTQSNPYVVS